MGYKKIMLTTAEQQTYVNEKLPLFAIQKYAHKQAVVDDVRALIRRCISYGAMSGVATCTAPEGWTTVAGTVTAIFAGVTAELFIYTQPHEQQLLEVSKCGLRPEHIVQAEDALKDDKLRRAILTSWFRTRFESIDVKFHLDPPAP